MFFLLLPWILDPCLVPEGLDAFLALKNGTFQAAQRNLCDLEGRGNVPL